MKVAIQYVSKTGNTKLLVDVIKEVYGEDAFVSIGAPSEQVEADRYFIGSWTDKGVFDSAIMEFLKTLEGKQVVLFGTAGFGGSPAYFDAILQRTMEVLPASNQVLGTFMCQGKMPQGVRLRYEKLLAQDPENEQIQAFLTNFDEALTHPNAQDLANFREFLIRGKQTWQ